VVPVVTRRAAARLGSVTPPKAADGLLIKPAACPAGTTCTPGQIPGKDTRQARSVRSRVTSKQVGANLTNGQDGNAQSPSQVFHGTLKHQAKREDET
jgi:hypothetical protein